MSGDFQLSTPFLGGGGYRPRSGLLGDYRLRLDPMFCQANLGWFACLPAGGPRPLGLTLGNGLDVAIKPALGAFARDALTAKDPAPVAARHLLSAGSPL